MPDSTKKPPSPVRLAVLGGLSTLAAIGLLWALVDTVGVAPQVVLGHLGGLDPAWLAAIVGLTALNILISAEKWRLIMAARAKASAETVDHPVAFFYTALGALLGQVMLPQLSTTLLRGLAARLHTDKSAMAGARTAVIEQSFDLIVGLLLAAATVLVIAGLLAPPHWPWAVVLMLAAVSLGACLIGRWRRPFGLTPGLGLTLVALSGLRYLVLAARAVLVVWCAALPLVWWLPAMTLPLAQLSTLLAVTPGNLGITEWGWSGALALLGVPMAAAASFVLVHRVLGLAGQVATVAIAAVCLMASGSGRLVRHRA
jgi:hypothetical protein